MSLTFCLSFSQFIFFSLVRSSQVLHIFNFLISFYKLKSKKCCLLSLCHYITFVLLIHLLFDTVRSNCEGQHVKKSIFNSFFLHLEPQRHISLIIPVKKLSVSILIHLMAITWLTSRFYK